MKGVEQIFGNIIKIDIRFREIAMNETVTVTVTHSTQCVISIFFSLVCCCYCRCVWREGNRKCNYKTLHILKIAQTVYVLCYVDDYAYGHKT